MTRKLDAKKVYNFWKSKALKEKITKNASWGDLLMKKEIEVILERLKEGDQVLDIGCANGYSSIQFAKAKKIKLTGIDYVPEMIKYANIAKKKLHKRTQKRLHFKIGNALMLDFKDNTFDKINMTRCLCNLSSLEDQIKALKEAHRVLKPGGILLVSEPTKQGLQKLNHIGKFFKLKPLKSPWHNLYLDEKKFLKSVNSFFYIKISHFSSSYYLVSRIIYRRIKKDRTELLKRDSLFNKVALVLPPIGDWGVQRLYILTKKIEKSSNLS